jgi:hypothetical protein
LSYMTVTILSNIRNCEITLKYINQNRIINNKT